MHLRKAILAGLLGFALSVPVRLNAQYQTQEVPFGGLNLTAAATALDPRFAVEANNVWYLREGGIQTRPGFARIGSTDISSSTPWLLGRIYRNSTTAEFIVGNLNYLWLVGNNGSFVNPDSIIQYSTGSIDLVSGSNKIIGRGTKWATRIQIGDSLVTGANRWRIIRIKEDSVLYVSANAGATATVQAYRILLNFEGSTFGSFVQVNDQIIGGSEQRGAIVLKQNTSPSLLGLIAQGAVGSTNGTNTLTDGNAAFTTNLYAGYAVLTDGLIENQDGLGTRVVSRIDKIKSNTATVLTLTGSTAVGEDKIGAGSFGKLNYYIFPPVFTLIDTGTVRARDAGVSIFHDTRASAADTSRFESRIIEFLSGRLVGQQFNINAADPLAGGAGDSILISVNSNDITAPVRDYVEIGDKYAVWSVGVSGRYFTWYNNQLVVARSKLFPNEIRFTNPGSLTDFAPLNYRVVSQKLGSEITGLAPLGSDLVVTQGGDTWKLSGASLPTASLIQALIGIGCPAPNTLKVSGNMAYWLGILNGIPAACAWSGGGLKFNTVGQSSVYSGENQLSISPSVVPLFKGITISQISKASAGFWEDHYILSVPDSGSSGLTRSLVYHIPTARWATATNFYGSLFYNATSAPDSGQLYYTAADRGRLFLFGGVENDTGAQIALTYTTGDFTLGGGRYEKQLGQIETEAEKVNTTALTVQLYKNLPAASQGSFSLLSGLTGYRTGKLGFNGIVGKSFRFRLSYQAGQSVKIYGFRFSYLETGVP